MYYEFAITDRRYSSIIKQGISLSQGCFAVVTISDHELSPVQGDFLAYWRLIAGDRIAPPREAFDVLHVPMLMPYAVIFDVLSDPLDFRHRLVGTAVREMFYRDYTGVKMSEIEGRGPGSIIWSMLDLVRTSRQPAFDSTPYVGPKKDFLRLHNLFLPFVDDDMLTTMIIVVSYFRPKSTA